MTDRLDTNDYRARLGGHFYDESIIFWCFWFKGTPD